MLIVASHRQSPGEAIRFTAEDFIDCFVASAPRNDDVADFQFSAAFPHIFRLSGQFFARFPSFTFSSKFSSLSKNLLLFSFVRI